jgi:outer membrane protein
MLCWLGGTNCATCTWVEIDMRPLRLRLIAATAALPLSAAAATAADIGPVVPPDKTAERSYDLVLELGLGAAYGPAYEGASEDRFTPWPIVTLHYLWLPGFGEVKGNRRDGFSFGPDFRYVRKREAADYAALRGLNDVDGAFEVGGKFAYTFGIFRAHATLRRGFGGHEGFVGEAGIDATFYPTSVTEVSFGPRMSYADAEYMRTYLGVTPAESITSGLAAYDPRGGIKGVGAELNARYMFTPQWSVLGTLQYERLVGDAADSPIAQAGSVDQFTAKLGLSYRFGLNLFR